MSLPFFYSKEVQSGEDLQLNEETSKHISQVLRMLEGDKIQLTDGKGLLQTAAIITSHKRHTSVKVIDSTQTAPTIDKRIIGISPIKNSSRFEWFLEKCTEIGIDRIILLNCERSERKQYRMDRMNSILISALIQSRQVWLPELIDMQHFNTIVQNNTIRNKYIAHCIDLEKENLFEKVQKSLGDQLILIGPEGDFTSEEVNLATSCNFTPVSLSHNRLRTETAGIAACLMLNLK